MRNNIQQELADIQSRQLLRLHERLTQQKSRATVVIWLLAIWLIGAGVALAICHTK